MNEFNIFLGVYMPIDMDNITRQVIDDTINELNCNLQLIDKL